jgi:TolB protein
MRFRVFFLSAFVVGMGSILSAAPIDVKIERSGKSNLGLSTLQPGSRGVEASIIQSVQETLSADLKFSRLFNLVENGPTVKTRNDVEAWAQLGSEFVFGGTFDQNAKGVISVDAKLYDTRAKKELIAFRQKGTSTRPRALAHEVANEISKYFTGQPGIFLSKLAFVNDATGRKELYLADYDGRGLRRVTNDNSIVILPRLSPNGQKVIFTSYIGGNPDLYIMSTDGTGRKKISSKAGLNVSPSWSPNNSELALTLSINGPPNIYLMDSLGTLKSRITDAQGADTAPSFSPDGTQIAFTSDRAGAPHIYIMSMDGTGVRRLTTDGHCDSAAWSPDGQTIVYVKGFGKTFDIYSIEVLTGIERRLTWGDGDSENPAWSPDGRFILFISTRHRKSELFIMNADGTEQRPVPINKAQTFTPHWSY